jgi:hypothetical protein
LSNGRPDWYKWNVLLLIICLWIGWHYWVYAFISSTPFSLLGAQGLPPPRYGTDFYGDYLAVKSWLSHGNPYVANSQPTSFIYAPTSLPFYAVFTLIPFESASQLWVVASLSFFVVGLLGLALTLHDDRRWVYVSLALLLFLTSYPLLVNFQLGQNDLLLAGLVILSLACERLNLRFLSAGLLSIATILKGPAVLLLIYFVLFRRDLQYLIRFLVSTLLIVGASLLVVPVSLYSYWTWNVLPTFSTAISLNTDPSFLLYPNESVIGLLVLAHLSQITLAVSVTAWVLFGVFSVWVTSKKILSGHGLLRADAMFLMNILVILLFSPRNTIYPYVGVMLPLALFLSALLIEQVNLSYLTLVAFATLLLNSVLSPNFLYTPILLPLELIGGLILIISLIPIFICPSLIFKKT